MNASAYLKGHGWRGEGYPLDYSDRGISKPLLVSHKQDLNGLGTVRNPVASQWWLNAFDDSLKAFGTGSRASPSSNVPKASGLYGNFVKADTLKSTIESLSMGNNTMAKKSKIPSNETNGNATSVIMEDRSEPQSALHTLVADPSEKSSKKRKHREDKQSHERHDKRNKILKTQEGLPSKSETEHPLTPETPRGDLGDKGKKKKRSKTQKQSDSHRSETALLNESSLKTGINIEAGKTESGLDEPDSVANVESIQNSKSSEATGTYDAQDPHPESIAALMKRGIYVDLQKPPKQGFSNANAARFASGPNSQQLGESESTPNAPKKKSLKTEKIEREKAKRVAKREAKHWAEVRANPHLYRPDGTMILDTGYSNPLAELRAKHQAKLLEMQQNKAAKQAKRALKEQMKVERRVARKMRRSEKKRNNHMAMQAHISAKIKKQKLEKDQIAAAERGMTLEAYQKMVEDDRAAARLVRDTAKAQKLGITLEEFQKQREKHLDEKELAKEARELGLSLEEYVNQDAEIDDAIIDSFGIDPGSKDGTYEHFGRSPVDKIWAKYQANDANPQPKMTSEATAPLRGEQSKPDHDDSSSDSSSTDSSDTDGKSGQMPTINNQSRSKTVGSTTSIAEGEDFIPLDFGNPTGLSIQQVDGSLPFMIDTTGNPNLPLVPPEPKKSVRDMTKEERKARLELMRARRAERAANAGVKKLSKKERRKKRTERKEQMLSKMAQDILNKKNQEARERGELASSTGDQAGGGSKLQRNNSKQKTKEARREARRIMRGMKKGKIDASEIMPGWEVRGKQKNKLKRGNGGREPKRPESSSQRH